MTDQPTLMGTSAVARELRLSENVVRRKADEGLIECVRDSSNKRLFTTDAVREFKRQHEAGR